MKWDIGCSGFSYKEWKGTFYPEKLPQNKWFDYYCTQFNTLELNVTFYRFPQLSFLQNWYNKSPQGFSFAVKVPRLITHYKQMQGTESLLDDFYKTCKDGLQDKLGPVLFQFPPKFSYTKERLEKIIKAVDPAHINVVEFRHSSWWSEEVYTQLAKHAIVFSGESHPALPDEVVINTPVVYYRFHGVPKLYYSEYDEKFIKSVADAVLANKKVKQVYCYFNNTAAIAAIHNAHSLQKFSKSKKPAAAKM